MDPLISEPSIRKDCPLNSESQMIATGFTTPELEQELSRFLSNYDPDDIL